MKPLVALVIVFFSLSQAQFQSTPIWLSCTSEYLLVMVDRDFFRDGIILHPYQVVLGNDCQVNSLTLHRLYLIYEIWQCGIVVETTPDEIKISSYVSVTREDLLSTSLMIPVVCRVTREKDTKRLHFHPGSGIIRKYSPWESLSSQASGASESNDDTNFLL